jgi:HIV-1 Vpr-binding protein
MYSGDLHWINLETGITEINQTCHNSLINSIKQSKDGSLLLTSSTMVPPLSALWRTGESLDLVYHFTDEADMNFGQLTDERLIGTNSVTANVFDTETGETVASFYNSNLANNYEHNKACFNCTDTLILNDGVIWDIRANPAIEYAHKFDKLSSEYSGIFHPNNLEVLICGQVVCLFKRIIKLGI